MTRDYPTIAVAGFAVDAAGARTVEVESGPPTPAASLLKPLLAWAAAKLAPVTDDAGSWAALGRAAVTASDNDATAALWSRAGEDRLLSALNDLLGTNWSVGDGREHPALRVLVTAVEVAHGYAALVADDSRASAMVRQWMREVPPHQTFGVRPVACETLSVEEDRVGVKCGWFGGERAHAVVVVEAGDRSVGGVVLTSHAPSATTRAVVQAGGRDDTKLIEAHEKLAGAALRSAVHRALMAANEL